MRTAHSEADMLAAAVDQIRAKVRMVVANDYRFAGLGLSTGEKIAVAMVLDRFDLVHECWGTMLEAVYRLNTEWTAAALHVQRNGWTEED